MISWIEYTTITVPPIIEGVISSERSSNYEHRFEYGVSYTERDWGGATISSTTVPTRMVSYSGKYDDASGQSVTANRTGFTSMRTRLGRSDTSWTFSTRYDFKRTYTKNSTIAFEFPVGFHNFNTTIIAPAITVIQQTTTTRTRSPVVRATTAQGTAQTLVWSTTTSPSYYDDEEDKTYPSTSYVWQRITTVNSTLRSTFTVAATSTLVTNRNEPPDTIVIGPASRTSTATTLRTSSFITWTDLEADQITVANTIWEDPKGFAYFTYGSLPSEDITPDDLDDRDANNGAWSPISQLFASTATRITQSQEFYRIRLSAVEGNLSDTFSVKTITRYFSPNNWQLEWAGQPDDAGYRPTSSTTHSRVKIMVQNLDNFPFTTTNQPQAEDNGDGEYETEEWPGYLIRKFNTLISVPTSATGVDYSPVVNYLETTSYDRSEETESYSGGTRNVTTRTQISRTNSGGTTNTYTEVLGAQSGATNERSITSYIRVTAGLTVDFANPVLVFPRFAPPAAFGSPNLNFSRSTFTQINCFLELQGAQITLNRGLPDTPLVYKGFGGGVSVPVPLPTFTANAMPTTTISYEDEGFSESYYDQDTKKWTSATVSRQGENFSSTWAWQVNSSSTTSSSAKAQLVEKHPVPTDIVELNWRTQGGAVFPHASFTIINSPNVILITTYDASNSGTSSKFENAYSENTTKSYVGNATLTISSYISSLKGRGFRTVNLHNLTNTA